MKNIWKDGVLGVVTGDALGCPVEFDTREQVAGHPVTGMQGWGTFNLPSGSWTDDSSLTLALLESIGRLKTIDLNDIMDNFVKWLYQGEFTPFHRSFDVGRGTMNAIRKFKATRKPLKCGGYEEWNIGNGSLMRILPACLYCCEKQLSDQEAVSVIHQVGSLTHAHICCNIACGLYYFMVKAVLHEAGSLTERLQSGLAHGVAYYQNALADQEYVQRYDRLRDLALFSSLPADQIRSSGYVVDTLEAAVWSLLQTDSFDSALLKAVNLGYDTDTVGAVTGGLAGLYYGWETIPKDWLNALQRLNWISGLCENVLNEPENETAEP